MKETTIIKNIVIDSIKDLLTKLEVSKLDSKDFNSLTTIELILKEMPKTKN